MRTRIVNFLLCLHVLPNVCVHVFFVRLCVFMFFYMCVCVSMYLFVCLWTSLVVHANGSYHLSVGGWSCGRANDPCYRFFMLSRC